MYPYSWDLLQLGALGIMMRSGRPSNRTTNCYFNDGFTEARRAGTTDATPMLDTLRRPVLAVTVVNRVAVF